MLLLNNSQGFFGEVEVGFFGLVLFCFNETISQEEWGEASFLFVFK